MSRRLFKTNDNGEREYLDDKAIAEARAKAAQDVKDWCELSAHPRRYGRVASSRRHSTARHRRRSAAVSRLDASDDDFFIPDFCATRMVFAVVLVAELLAVTLSLARPAADFLTELARVSMFLQWLGLTSAAVLCYTRRWIKGLTVARSSLVVFGLLVANTVVISEVALWFETGFDRTTVAAVLAPSASWPFLLRNTGICVIVTALLLRYFFVTHQWHTHVRRRSAFAHSGAAGAHSAALPVQQHEHDRGAHAQRSRACRGSRRGSRGPVPRHVA